MRINILGIQQVNSIPQSRHTGFIGAILMFAAAAYAPAQQENQLADTSNVPTAYLIADSGPDYRIWQQPVAAFTNGQGQVVYRTNSYTELATGMNVLSNGQWIPASENIQITPGGGAATNGQHQVFFAANVNASNAVQIATPEVVP